MEGAAAAPSAPVSAAKQADAVRNPSCFLSPEVGPCRARRPMWYYDSQSRRCQRFFWGGCKGNENRFRSEAECAETCEDAEQEEFESEQKKVQRLPEEFSQEALENHILSRPAEPKCHMGNESYSRGDIVRFPHEQCKVCVCATPPSLTCGIAPCPAIAFIPQPGKICSPVKDKHGCCQIGLKCVDPPKPEKKDVCASRPCPALGFIPQAGKTCHPKMDEDGCCQIGLSCYSTEPLSREEVCAYRPCPAIGFPNKPGHVCEPVMDDDGCCQVGVTCLSTSPPEVKENPCAGRPCPAMAFLPQEGKVCTPEMDADGCCQVGLSCKEERSEEDASVPDPCFRRPCPLIAFLPQPGKTCTEVKDADGCCQVGLKCV